MAEGNYGIKKTDALEEQIERIKIKWHTKMETTDPSISEIFKKGLDLLEEELYTDKSKTKEYANNTAEEIAESKFKSLESWLIKLFEQGAITQELLNLILIIKSKDNTIHQNAVLAYRNNKDKEAEDREIEYQNCNKLEDYVEAEKELLIDVGLENPEFISVAKAIVDRKVSDFEETEDPDDGLSDEELYQQNRQQ